MTKDELKVLRMNLVGGMNEYMSCINDETAYYDYWIQVVPDECTEDDLESIAESDELFNDVCKLFGFIIRHYGEDIYIK